MEDFLAWLFGREPRLRNLLESIYTSLSEWGSWWAARGINLLIAWWGQYVDVINYWYDRIKTVVYDAWEYTYLWIVTYVAQIWDLVVVWFDRIAYVVNGVWLGFQRVFGEWWARVYKIFEDWWLRVEEVIFTWYSNIRTLVLDWYEQISNLVSGWYDQLLYYVQNLPNARQVLTDWFPWLAWLFAPDTRERLFAFLQDPIEAIWLWLLDEIEERLEWLLESVW